MISLLIRNQPLVRTQFENTGGNGGGVMKGYCGLLSEVIGLSCVLTKRMQSHLVKGRVSTSKVDMTRV